MNEANKQLKVSFNSPQCGWMSIGFDDGQHEFHTTTAHAPHERALPQLLEILTDLLDENSAGQEFLLQWNRNPEEFDFWFKRNEQTVKLEIWQYAGGNRFTDEREKMFIYEGEARQFCTAFYQTFAHLHADVDTDVFEQNWHQKFPEKEFQKFSHSLNK